MQDFGIILPFLLGITVTLCVVATRCYFQITEGSIGAVSEFGRMKFVDFNAHQARHFGPGIHFKKPWEKVHTASIKEEILDLSGEQHGIMAMTSDGTMLRLDSKLRLTSCSNQIYNVLFALDRPIEHIKGLFSCLLRNEIANFDSANLHKSDHLVEANDASRLNVGSYAVIRSQRQRLNDRIMDFCRMQIGSKYGVNVNGVDVTDIVAPDELAVALNSVIGARSEAEKNFAETESACEQRLLSAQKGLSISKSKATAVETEISVMGELLEEIQINMNLKDYVERRKTEVYSESRVTYVRRKS